MRTGFRFPITTEDPNTGSWIFNPPRGSHPFPPGQAVCLDKVGRERSTNTLQSSGLAILRRTTGEKTHAAGKSHEESQLCCVHQQEQGAAAALSAVGTLQREQSQKKHPQAFSCSPSPS